MLRFHSLIVFWLLLSALRWVESHEGHESASTCHSNQDVMISANYLPGVVTVDGRAEDWAAIDGVEFDLRPALDWDQDKSYSGGQMTLKTLHDGSHVFFLLQVDGDYAYALNNSKMCPSVALMFQIGENASYHNMGNCKDMPGSCTAKSCRGYEVDIMHFSIGTAIPGGLYGSNPIDNNLAMGSDRFGHLVDAYAWNPHCMYLDGNDSNARNDWQGSWWHSSLGIRSDLIEEDSPYSTDGQKGTYIFEFSRPLRTADKLRQDVQFAIGKEGKLSVAFWYPVNGVGWRGHQHYTVSCDWLPFKISPASGNSPSEEKWDATTGFTLVLSILSIGLSVCIGFFSFKTRSSSSIPFTPMDRM
ncbi:Heme binding protein [Zostera marina]|uniref:Heme binding protein n=1 Tax=Zostera marina TaxID=29655 RepID=A0A0K9PL32_ZOSMR|nr:Heme binding protein [Zostera marina]